MYQQFYSMKWLLFFILFISMYTVQPPSAAQKTQPTHQKLYADFEKYKEPAITHRRFKHSDVVPLLQKRTSQAPFTGRVIGKSVQNRSIHLLKAGQGPVNIMLWSQMHGDEPTATMALLDIFRFLSQQGDGWDNYRQTILQNTTLYFIPLLNPDGAEAYQRRNALDIDLNRDALRLQSPEARLLKSLRDSLQPEFGFNLHDQNIRYAAGYSAKPATISFLAPAYNTAKDINPVRTRAMQVIAELNTMLQQHIPGQVGRWDDEFEPRAFGDNIQKWGTSLILVESGGYKNDPEKQHIRRLNFVLILEALYSIAQRNYEKQNIETYNQIPRNQLQLFDLVIRNATLVKDGRPYKADLGINRYEQNTADGKSFFYRSVIEEVGDMSIYYGFEEIDAEGLRAEPGKVFPEAFSSIDNIKEENIHRLLRQGYTAARVSRHQPRDKSTKLPINIVSGQKNHSTQISFMARPDFILYQGKEAHYAIVNGFVYDLKENKNRVSNALVY
jgi:hypothetical protein